MTNVHLSNYFILLTDFVSHGISASEFEKRFLEIHRSDPSDYSENVHRVISILFSDVDAYCSDSSIRNDDDLDDLGLCQKAKMALTELKKYVN